MRIGSLFSGAGGLDTAVQAVFGGKTVWHCENDKAASKVLAHRWPGVPNLHDITAVDWSAVEPVDIMCGGWPCQPFSLAGRRKGADDERALWPYVARAVRMVRPRIVALENVSAVLGPEFQRVTNDLAALGYDIAWTCLRASDVGAPHRRERLFILATDTGKGQNQRGDDTCLTGALLPTPSVADGMGGHLSRSGNRSNELLLPGVVKEIHAASESGPDQVLRDVRRGTETQEICERPTRGSQRVPEADALLSVMCERQGDGASGQPSVACSQNQAEGPVRGLRHNRETAHSPQGPQPSQQRSEQPSGPVQQLSPEVALARGSRVQSSADSGICWGRYEAAIRRWEAVLGRPAPNPTEPNRNGNPRLNPEFSSWMMGWPAGWVTAVPGISRNDALRIIGNGVVRQQATAALRWLLSVSEVAA